MRTSTTYLRTGGSAPFEPRQFEPLDSEHPLVGDGCPGCDQPFAVGDVVTLLPLGPGDDEDARERAAAGRIYNAVAIPLHWACATGKEPE